MNRTTQSIKPQSAVRIGALFIGAVLASYLAIFAFSEWGYLSPLIEYTVAASVYLMNLAGLDPLVSVLGDRVLLKSRTLVITLECTAIFIMALYWSLVAVYPAPIKRKLGGLAFGLPAIVLANLLRLLILALVSERLPGYFDYVHDFLWQVAFILLTAALWIFWTTRSQGHGAKTAVCP
jgi:exosortase/archaeosortase family protein